MQTKQVQLIYLVMFYFVGMTILTVAEAHRIRIPYSEHLDVRGRCWYKAQNRFLDRYANYTRPISFLECEHVECLPDFSLVIERCPPQRQKCPIRLGDPSASFPHCCPTCDYSLLREWNVQTRNEANRGSRDNPIRC